MAVFAAYAQAAKAALTADERRVNDRLLDDASRRLKQFRLVASMSEG